MSEIIRTLGMNIARIRQAKGISRAKLASQLNLTELALTRLEEGDIDVDIELAQNTAEILRVKLEDLFTKNDEREKIASQIKNKLALCSETELALVVEYIRKITSS